MNARIWLWAGVVCGGVACVPEGPRIRSGPVPAEDGDRVIAYDVDVVEDDTDCGARVPYKESKENLVVEWHTDRDVTLYSRGGLYQTDVELDDEGRYSYSGAGGPCLPRSRVDGRLDRHTGEASATCIKRDCVVRFTSKALRRPPDAGVMEEDAGMNAPDGGPASDGGQIIAHP